MHRFTENDGQDSRATLAGGRHGMMFGALAGALLLGIGSLILDLMFSISTGGPGVNAIAGAAAGGLAGMMIGALRARHHGGYHAYHGPERRLRLVPIQGPDRRHMH